MKVKTLNYYTDEWTMKIGLIYYPVETVGNKEKEIT